MTLGGERVHEKTTIDSFYAPGGGLEFFTAGHSPVSLEILSTGHYKNLGGAGGFGPELETEIPLVASVPGAPYASVETIKVKAGSAYGPKVKPSAKGKKPTYYGTVAREGQMPERRLQNQDRSHLRRSGRPAAAERDARIRRTLPHEVGQKVGRSCCAVQGTA